MQLPGQNVSVATAGILGDLPSGPIMGGVVELGMGPYGVLSGLTKSTEHPSVRRLSHGAHSTL